MVILKRNLWILYFVIVTTGTMILFSLVYTIYHSDYDEFIKKQENITGITASSMNSIFLQYEMVLDILGKQLLKNKTYLDTKHSKELLNSLLEINPTLSAFALVKKNGEVYAISENLAQVKNLPNLLEMEETKETFLQALKSSSMVVGRTYFNKSLNSLVIPIRKAMRDKNGNVLAVMIAGIKVDKVFNLLSNTQIKTILIRNFDGYVQLLNFEKKDHLKNFYKIKIPKEHSNANIKKTEKKYKKSIEYIKEKEKIFTIDYTALITNKEVLSSIQYLKRYDIWVVSQIEKSIINNIIIKQISILVLIFFIVMFVFYLLFKNLYNYEKKKQRALLYQARHDHLTGLNNRLYVSQEFLKKENLQPFSLLFIDLDNFKTLNDNYGHNFGDRVLVSVTKRLKSFKKEEDSLIRYSGDEFLLITKCVSKEKISVLAEKILKKISEPYIIDGYKFIVGGSIGICQYPNDGNSFDEVKRYADIAMYEAKKDKNSFRFFEDSIKHKYLRSAQIEQELKKAIVNNEIYVVYQPQVTKEGKLFGVEALVRWENDSLGFIPPDEFIKVAESTGHMIKLGRYIMKKSIEDIKEIQNLSKTFFNLSINISVKQFMDNDFFDKLLEYIKKSDFNKEYLTLEVTENVFIEDLDYILKLLNKIREYKIKISLDDFGTGYSSLSILKKLPIKELKIDKSFVDDILIDNASNNMIRSIISIGKKFDLETVAEGIETDEQKDILDEYGCDLYQGYLFSKPLKKEELLKFIENRP